MVSLNAISGLVSEAAASLKIPAQVVAATPAGRDSAYVEVIMTVVGCGEEPCHVLVGLHRDRPLDELRTTIEARLREHPRLHGRTLTS
jgi:hypothetical protein